MRSLLKLLLVVLASIAIATPGVAGTRTASSGGRAVGGPHPQAFVGLAEARRGGNWVADVGVLAYVSAGNPPLRASVLWCTRTCVFHDITVATFAMDDQGDSVLTGTTKKLGKVDLHVRRHGRNSAPSGQSCGSLGTGSAFLTAGYEDAVGAGTAFTGVAPAAVDGTIGRTRIDRLIFASSCGFTFRGLDATITLDYAMGGGRF